MNQATQIIHSLNFTSYEYEDCSNAPNELDSNYKSTLFLKKLKKNTSFVWFQHQALCNFQYILRLWF